MKEFYKFFILFIFLIISCKEHKQETNKNSENIPENIGQQKSNIKTGKLFFDYNAIDYYTLNISENEAVEFDKHTINSKLDEIKYDIITGEYPKNISDINLIDKLTEIGYNKSEINKNDFSKINEIFVEKSERDGIYFACIPVFRDIIVFKKNNKIVGITKICFQCNQSQIVGTNVNIDNFGQGDDFEKLQLILHNK